MVIAWAPRWEKKEKKSASEAIREVFWPEGTTRLAIYFFYLILFFVFFPNCGAWSQAIWLRLTSNLEKQKNTRELWGLFAAFREKSVVGFWSYLHFLWKLQFEIYVNIWNLSETFLYLLVTFFGYYVILLGYLFLQITWWYLSKPSSFFKRFHLKFPFLSESTQGTRFFFLACSGMHPQTHLARKPPMNVSSTQSRCTPSQAKEGLTSLLIMYIFANKNT